MATFQNPIGAQNTTVPTVQAPVQNTAVADTINAATQLLGAYQSTRPGPPSQAEITEQRKTVGFQSALEVEENYRHLRDTQGGTVARSYLQRETRNRMSEMSATEAEAFQGQLRSTVGGSMFEADHAMESDARKAEFEQMQEWKRKGMELLGPLAEGMDEDYLATRGWAYESEVRRRQDEQARLAVRSSQRQEGTEELNLSVRAAIPEAMANAIEDVHNIQLAVQKAPEGERESARRNAIAQLRVMSESPGSVFRNYLPTGGTLPDQERKEFEGIVQFQMELLSGEFDQALDDQDIDNIMSHYGREAAQFDGMRDNMALAAIMSKTGVNLTGAASFVSGVSSSSTTSYSPNDRDVQALFRIPQGAATALNGQGVRAGSSEVPQVFRTAADTVAWVDRNQEKAGQDNIRKSAMVVSNTIMDVARGRRDLRSVALSENAYGEQFLSRFNEPVSPLMKEEIENAFGREGTTALDEWTESFRVFTRGTLEPSLSSVDPRLTSALQFERSDGRIKVSVDWGATPMRQMDSGSPMARRGDALTPNSLARSNTNIVLRKTEREINRYIESYVNLTNGSREEIVDAMIATLEARRRVLGE